MRSKKIKKYLTKKEQLEKENKVQKKEEIIGVTIAFVGCTILLLLAVFVSKLFYILAIPLIIRTVMTLINETPNFLKNSKTKQKEKKIEDARIKKINKEKSDLFKGFKTTPKQEKNGLQNE